MKAHCISCFNTEQIKALQHELASRFCKQNMMVFDLAILLSLSLTVYSSLSKPIPLNAGLLILYERATH